MIFRRSVLAAAGLVLAAAAPLAAAQSPAGKLVLYTSQPQADAQATIDAFRKVHPGVEVSFTRDGTTQLMNKLRAEFTAGAPQADVLFIADAMTMEALKKDKRLLAYPEARTEGFPVGAHDADKTYFATKLITTGIVVNKAAPLRPTRWADLARPELKGQLIMPSPLYSGAAAIHMGVLTRTPALGWGYYEQLAKNGTQSARGNGAVLEAVAGGQKLYGVLVDFMAIRAAQRGSPIDFVFPEDGVTVVTEPVAILSSTRNPAAAKAFVDFLLSPDGQGLAAQQGMMPAHPDVAAPAGFPKLATVKMIPADIAAILAGDEQDKERFADLFGR
ncbi:MAG: ABC transporter substrate-binding protein [Alphaproteobacteria bacterium]|nr:ABC transporter substrate-binding protein [Alphaproteobacteria bacterium]